MLSSDILTRSMNLIIIFVSVTFHSQFVLQQFLLSTPQIIAAGFEVVPLWGDIGNATQPCFIDNSSIAQGAMTFHGSPDHVCSLQVSSDQHVRIAVPRTYSEENFFYVEKLNDCPQRYVAIHGEAESCNVTVTAENFQLNLRSNASVSLGETKSNESVSKCGELNPSNEYEDLVSCTNLQEYVNVSQCESEEGLAGSCRFHLPSSCNVSLSKHEAILLCQNSELHNVGRVLLVYYVRITQLSFSYNNIVNISINTFSDLGYLQELYLDHNKLDELEPGVFDGLVNLECLSLEANQLSSLDSTIFRGLVKLEKLVLTDNKLTDLPGTLIQDLVNLQDVQLSQNMLVTLDSSVFHGLNKIHTIILKNNHLTSLPIGLFNGLVNLQHVFISDNEQLETVPHSLFEDSKNITQLYMSGNKLGPLPIEIFQGLEHLDILLLNNNPLKSITFGTFQGLNALRILHLHYTMLTKLTGRIFQNLGNLMALTFQSNELNSIDADAFKGLHNLEILTLHYNNLEILPPKVFDDLRELTLLRLNSNNLSTLDTDIFRNLAKLSFLDVSRNNFIDIPVGSQVLSQLTIFAFSHNPLRKANKELLSNLGNETNVIVSQHEICECYAPQDVQCWAEDDRSPYLTCDRLLSDRFLVVVMWLIGILSIGGNLFVIVWKQLDSRGNKVQSILLTNLAISDLLMGVYMIIIASADIYFGNNFPLQSEMWRSSVTCKIAGTLSILSSEASVFFVTLISIDRFLHINFPFSTKKFNKKSVLLISTLTWLVALILGLVPNILAGRNFKFYDNSHVCIGFPLALLESFTKKPLDPIDWYGIMFNFFSSYSISNGYSTGLYYSTALFLGLNCICYLVILGCYLAIIRAVRASSKRTGRSQDMNMQIKMTVKVTAIVATDFLCWFPIIILGILVQAGAVTLPPSVFAWLVTCVLPINSAVNPYLYTISEVISTQRKKSESLSMKTRDTTIS